MSYRCIKIENPEPEYLEKLTEELKEEGFKEEVDYVLFDMGEGSYFLDFTSEASSKLQKISLMEKYGIEKSLIVEQ